MNAPIFSERAVTALANFLENTSQVLPLKHEKEKFYAINILNIVDGFDKQKSKIKYFNSGKIMNIEEYFFHCDKIVNQHIFKIPERLKSTVFVSDVFVQAVKDHSLKGFIFKETGLTLSK
ncbi:imm11 family protein [Paenibacillus sp. V4I5]|uniref:imm11 family protein n=1 Tax=Paenibacillus sp. V4I5 TaxID=3042306 RepID=UPI0035934A5F